MKEAEKQSMPIVNANAILTDYLQEGQTTLHHRESLKERFKVMRQHFGLLTTFVMHCWFVFRSIK